MRVVVQRVKKSKVKVNDEVVSEIGKGILALVGIEKWDTEEIVGWVANKIVNLRIFEDTEGKMNLSVKDIGGEILLVSQFTLAAYIKKGNRPSFSEAMEEELAREYFDKFVSMVKNQYPSVKTGIFKAHMEIELVNDGPVTIIIERYPRDISLNN
ncbi:D-aminoacyl-tRNA deacylase [Caldisericum exile]|uniref:D-aminoacyl-tRNA deacylase n=1 Tax=Caldisericum exile (strain DSM 21853 / NBRC 104410 / AZM16c01) TaxID=511051 RepID=A0A7U6JGM4_CALEA|nr:D-aminoacyl-tRNA deacylase [Caldisericum exile]BAL80452.1 D-tyrosyl-tRNA(Tyr) deacylase [Caldisericum exile AZM16c01]